MGNVLNPEPMRRCHYAVLDVNTVTNAGVQYTTHIIVVRDDVTGTVLGCTGLEYFSAPYTGTRVQYRKTDRKPYLHYVVQALNYVFKTHWWTYGITRLTDVTLDILHDFLDDYVYEPIGDERFHGQQSIDICIKAVSNFWANIALVAPDCKVSADELFRSTKVTRERKYGTDTVVVQVPTYKGRAQAYRETMLMRDTYPEAIDMLVAAAELHDPMMVFPIVAMDTTGIRGGEVVQLRQACSPISNVPGIVMGYMGDQVTSIQIDLSFERKLRADAKVTGGIKTHKPIKVYRPFIPRFLEAYRFHVRLLETITYDKDYCPMLIDSRGQAMTKATFNKRFQRLVNQYWIPALMESGQPHLVSYAQELQSLHFRAHALRHHYTVKLVLAGLDATLIADYRRDSSLASAEVYVRNKRQIEGRLRQVHECAIDDIIKHNNIFGK